jgi:hypothetical protein
MRHELDGWRSAQERALDGAIDSDERVRAARPVVERSEDGARRLGDRYWLAVTRASCGLVSRQDTPLGVDLILLRRGPRLLQFGHPEATSDSSHVCCRYTIRGGLLARRPGGELALSQSGGDAPELRAAIRGFVPRWGGPLYEHVQRRLHVAISRRYFTQLIEEAQ